MLIHIYAVLLLFVSPARSRSIRNDWSSFRTPTGTWTMKHPKPMPPTTFRRPSTTVWKERVKRSKTRKRFGSFPHCVPACLFVCASFVCRSHMLAVYFLSCAIFLLSIYVRMSPPPPPHPTPNFSPLFFSLSISLLLCPLSLSPPLSFFPPQKGGRGSLMSPPCLES